MSRKNMIQAACMATLAFAAFSCSQEELQEGSLNGGTTVMATFEGAGVNTKTTVSDENKVLWSEGDKFALFYTDDVKETNGFTLKGSGGTTSGAFTGTSESGKTPQYAVFPFDQANSVSGGTLTMTLPATYTGYAGTSNGPMLAKDFYADNAWSNLQFNHLAALLKMTVNKLPAAATTLVVTASNEISGTFTANLSDQNPVLAYSGSDGGKTVTATFATAAGGSKTFYLPIPAGVYTDISAKLTDGNSTTFFDQKLTGTITLERANILVIPPFDYVEAGGSTPSAVNAALADKFPTAEEAPVTEQTTTVKLTDAITADASTAIELPVVQNSNVDLTFSQAPVTASHPLLISESSVTAEATASNKVTISMPSVASESAPSVTVTLPKTTVTLGAVKDVATYKKVIAKTAENTLIIDEGVTVEELVIDGGNVKMYGTVKKLTRGGGNTATVKVESFGKADIQVVETPANFEFSSVWDGESTVAPQVTGSDNTASCDIYTAAQLASFQQASAEPQTAAKGAITATINSNVNLYADIDLASKPWIGMVLGEGFTFDGKEHTVSNVMMKRYTLNEVSIYAEESSTGLFGAARKKAAVKNMTVNGFKAEGVAANAKWIGALVGFSYGVISYENCHVIGVNIISTVDNSCRIGGLIGFIDAVSVGSPVTLKNCSAKAVDITGSYAIGGLVGTTQGAETRNFEKCKVEDIELHANAVSRATKGGYSGTAFYSPYYYVGYMSKFIGDIGGNSKVINIDADCTVDQEFTEAEIESFGYGDKVTFAKYSYKSDASDADKTAAVNNATTHKLLKGNKFLPAQVDGGTIYVGGTGDGYKCMDYNHFEEQQATE